MNKLWIGLILMLVACNSKTNQRPKAVDIPMQKVLYKKFSAHDRTYNYYENNLYLIKPQHPKKRKDIFGDSYSSPDSLLQVSEYYDAYLFDYKFLHDPQQQITTFTNTDEYIAIYEDSAQLAGEMYLTSNDSISKIYIYYFDLPSVVDEDVYVLLDYKKDLLLMYSMPWGKFYQYDSQKRGQAYFDNLIDLFNLYLDNLRRKRREDRKKTNKMNPENSIIL
jgi:hypothetical protein